MRAVSPWHPEFQTHVPGIVIDFLDSQGNSRTTLTASTHLRFNYDVDSLPPNRPPALSTPHGELLLKKLVCPAVELKDPFCGSTAVLRTEAPARSKRCALSEPSCALAHLEQNAPSAMACGDSDTSSARIRQDTRLLPSQLGFEENESTRFYI